MAEIASGCPKIEELDISYCYEITDKSLAIIGSRCPNMLVLKRNLLNWLDPSQHVGIVPYEYLNACPQDGDSEAAAIANCMPHLLHLELRFLKLTAKGVTLISEGCKELEYIDLSGCANVSSRDIAHASLNLKNLKTIKRPNFYIPRSSFHAERYGHWQLYDERFQTDVFRIWWRWRRYSDKLCFSILCIYRWTLALYLKIQNCNFLVLLYLYLNPLYLLLIVNLTRVYSIVWSYCCH